MTVALALLAIAALGLIGFGSVVIETGRSADEAVGGAAPVLLGLILLGLDAAAALVWVVVR